MKSVLGGYSAPLEERNFSGDGFIPEGSFFNTAGGGGGDMYGTSSANRGSWLLGYNSSYSTSNPAEIRQIMSALTGNTYSYDMKTTWDANGNAYLGGITIYTHSNQGVYTFEPVLRFLADRIENYGTSMEVMGIIGAYLTDGVSLLAADGGFNIGLAGTSLNAGLDIYYDNNTDLAQMRLATYLATYGLGKALEKALITGEIAGSTELALRLGTLVYGEAWANQMRQKTKND
jgi:hypothetical protein